MPALADSYDRDILKKTMLNKGLIGQVYKVHSNAYFIKIGDSVVRCGARGILKIKSDGIFVGDFVCVDTRTIE